MATPVARAALKAMLDAAERMASSTAGLIFQSSTTSPWDIPRTAPDAAAQTRIVMIEVIPTQGVRSTQLSPEAASCCSFSRSILLSLT